MSCYRPWSAYRHPNGTVNQKQGVDTENLSLPCGACIGCHMDRSLQWSLRCRLEASSWTHNVFLTLTYDDKHLPEFEDLDRKAPRLFVRYLRRHLRGVEEAPDGSGRRPIRYFGCGEYGERSGRPHYHLLLFNVRFDDISQYGSETYTSRLVSKLWPCGTHLLGSVTPASASYVAGYALKKVSAFERSKYDVLMTADGEVYTKNREFPMMSLKPPIGYYWYAKYKSDLRNGFIVLDGKQMAVPRLFRDKLKADDPRIFEQMQWARDKKMASFDPADRTEERLGVRELVFKASKKHFKRTHMED